MPIVDIMRTTGKHMRLFRKSLAVGRQYSDCPGCGRDLSRFDRAMYCPDCGRQLSCKNQWQRMIVASAWLAHAAMHTRLFRRSRKLSSVIDSEPTPILVGYSNAMFKLGWRYERGGGAARNLPEALRCYRKSARLGNIDATIRLAAGEQVLTSIPTGLAASAASSTSR